MKMTEFEKKTGLVDLEELTKESDEVMGNEGGATPTPIISFITGITTGLIVPTGACKKQ